MGKALVVAGPRQLAYETFDDPALKPDEVRIRRSTPASARAPR